MNYPDYPLSALFLCGLLLLIPNAPAQAGSATWNSNPQNTKWNIAGNWTPGTVPNGPSDIATFAVSNRPRVSVTNDTEINEIVFNPAASAFSITASADRQGLAALTISGTGVTNNSGIDQNFIATKGFVFSITFTNSATAGDNTTYTAANNPAGGSGAILFLDNARAGSANFVLQPGLNGHNDGEAFFMGSSTAENATFNNDGAVFFQDGATAAKATFTNDGSALGSIFFQGTSTAANAVMKGRESITFEASSSVANATGWVQCSWWCWRWLWWQPVRPSSRRSR